MIDNLKKQLEKARQAMTGNKYQKSKTLENISQIPKPQKQEAGTEQSQIIQAKVGMTDKNKGKISEEELERARKSMSTLEQKKRREEMEEKRREEKVMRKRMLELEEAKKEREKKELEKEKAQLTKEESEKERQEKERLERIESAQAKREEMSQKNIASLPKVHTLRSDFLKSSEAEKASLASLSSKSTASEKEKWRQRKKMRGITKNIKTILNIFLIIFLLVGGSGTLYYSYSFWQKRQTSTIPDLPETLLAGDRYLDIRINDKTSAEIISSLRRLIRTSSQLNTITVIKLINQEVNPQTGQKYEYLVGIDEFDILNISLPRELTHFLKNNFVLGTFSKEDTNEIFYILQARSFSNVFNQLITNGNQIIQELFASFVTTEKSQKISTGTFQNSYLANINVRVLLDDGNVQAVYGWLDKENILITQSQEAFSSITETWRTSR